MTTAAELGYKTECDDLRRQLDAERMCNRNHIGTIQRLNAKLVIYERERDVYEATIEKLTAELAEARKGIVKPPY